MGSGHFTRVVLALLSLHACSALELKPRDDAKRTQGDDEVDRYSHFKVKPGPTFVATGALTVAATALQVATPTWVRGALGPACERGLGAALLKCVEYVNELKRTSPLTLTMGHGLLLKAVAEVLSQVIPQASASAAWLDPLRVVRSTIASLLSSSLTFYYWTRLAFVRGLTAPRWLTSLLGQRFGTSLAKMVVTQAVYRPVNVFLFLLAQSFFRGDGARKMVHVMRSKFRNGLIGGIVFFAASNLLMFSIPVPYLHPIVGAIAGLIFNVWLAMVAYQKDPAAATAAPTEEASSAAAALSAAADLVPSNLAAFPTTAAALGALGVAEGVAAVGIYGAARHTAAAKPGAGHGSHVPRTPTTTQATATI